MFDYRLPLRFALAALLVLGMKLLNQVLADLPHLILSKEFLVGLGVQIFGMLLEFGQLDNTLREFYGTHLIQGVLQGFVRAVQFFSLL